MALQAVKLKGRIGPDGRLEILDGPVGLPEGEVEVVVLYSPVRSGEEAARPSLSTWPTHDLGRFLGKSLRREELYDDDGR
ncbi:MAG: hypothetical protein ACUVV0_01915 [Anaerolineae bacterium]